MAPLEAPALPDARELWFLILHHISNSPVAQLLGPLEEALSAAHLLPERYDFLGAFAASIIA